MNLECRFVVVWPQRQTFVIRILLHSRIGRLLRADVRRYVKIRLHQHTHIDIGQYLFASSSYLLGCSVACVVVCARVHRAPPSGRATGTTGYALCCTL